MTIGTWIKQAAHDVGAGDRGLTTAERKELRRLRREVRRLKEEREILSKAAAWFGFVKVVWTDCVKARLRLSATISPGIP
jgi:transposase-like protein